MSRPPLPTMLTEGRSGMLLFGVTPPRRSVTPQQAGEIAARTQDRLAGLDLDGLVLYDIDDESDRNPQERPFPYLPTMDPVVYAREHLQPADLPTIVYRSVGKYRPAELTTWLQSVDAERTLSVFVGASSRDKPVHSRLAEAYELHAAVRPDLRLGGVVIPERYTRSGGEHLRMLAKQARGCSFFITQVVYDVGAAKSLLSDYFYTCLAQGSMPRPVLLTLSVCGSLKTLAFLQWLGVDVPRWLENSLRHASDPLAESVAQCLATARELSAYCLRLGMPFGFNVESVSIRRAEIDASTELARLLRAELDLQVGPDGTGPWS